MFLNKAVAYGQGIQVIRWSCNLCAMTFIFQLNKKHNCFGTELEKLKADLRRRPVFYCFFFLENTTIFGQKLQKLGLISSEDLFFRKHYKFRTKIARCLRIPHNFLSYPTHKILHSLPINYP